MIGLANGFYEYSGRYNDAFKFEKRGTFEGSSRIFCIYKWSDPTTDVWILSIIANNGIPEFEQPPLAIFSIHEDCSRELPNKTGWSHSHELRLGTQDTPPKLSFYYSD